MRNLGGMKVFLDATQGYKALEGNRPRSGHDRVPERNTDLQHVDEGFGQHVQGGLHLLKYWNKELMKARDERVGLMNEVRSRSPPEIIAC